MAKADSNKCLVDKMHIQPWNRFHQYSHIIEAHTRQHRQRGQSNIPFQYKLCMTICKVKSIQKYTDNRKYNGEKQKHNGEKQQQ